MNRPLPTALALAAAISGAALPLAISLPASAQPSADPQVRATIVPGNAPATAPVAAPAAVVPGSGDISLNFPAADVKVVAQGVLGDILKLPFTIAPGVAGTVTLVTTAPVPRAGVFNLFEDALKAANLAITQQSGVFTIRPLAEARAAGPVNEGPAPGFATETVTLQFVNAEEMRKLLDSVIPGVVTRADSGQNTLLLSGTTGQRANARALLAQFDVNWLRNMSFALVVPQRTDARLIVPELDKLINAPDAPTRGLVRLISMERLNGILAISAQRQYLDDVRRWIEILDREGENNERRLFVYRVQNGRSKDLAKVLNTAFGNTVGRDSASGGGDEFALNGSARSGEVATQVPDQAAPLGGPAAGAAPLAGNRETGVYAGQAAGAVATGTGPRALISSDEANNAIIIFGTPRDYAIMEDALRKLDVLPLQVLIEAAITEVTLNNDLRYGVQWNFQQGQTNFALTDGKTSIPTRVFPGFSFFFSNNNSISATLNALEARTRINVLSAPNLMVLNNQTAALQIGNQVPVATQSAVGVVNPDSPIVNSIEYRDTGVILKITPRVNASGLVLLDVAQEVSDVLKTDSSTINSPTISTRRISTSIAVQDGQVIALGGLIRDNRTRTKSGVPLLSRIPIIGGLLFGNTGDVTDRTELIVLLKPRVVRTVDDAQAVTEELRAKIMSVKPIVDGPVR